MNTELKEDTKQMDKFLKGVHIGGSTFKDYLEKAQNVELKNELKNIIESFKRHEEATTSRIEQMGGDAPDTLGFLGTITEFFEKIKLIPVNNDLEVCDHAIKAMEIGIKQGEKFKEENKELDSSLMKDVNTIVNDYYNHLNTLNEIIRNYNR
ncbi:ferritin family protein [Clostridium botulinum]